METNQSNVQDSRTMIGYVKEIKGVQRFDKLWKVIENVIVDALENKRCRRKWATDIVHSTTAFIEFPENFEENLNGLLIKHIENKMKGVTDIDEYGEVLQNYLMAEEVIRSSMGHLNAQMEAVAHRTYRFLNIQNDKMVTKKDMEKEEITTVGVTNVKDLFIISFSNEIVDKGDFLASLVFKLIRSSESDEKKKNSIERFMKSVDTCSTVYEKLKNDKISEHLSKSFSNEVQRFCGAEKSISNERVIQNCFDVIEREEQLANTYLPDYTQHITLAAWRTVVLGNIDQVLDKCIQFIESLQLDKLREVVKLLSYSTESLEPLCKALQDYEGKVFTELRRASDDSNLCDKLLERYQTEKNFFLDVFKDLPNTLNALDKAVYSTMNAESGDKTKTGTSSFPEVLNKHCNLLMVKGTKGLTGEDLETKLDNIITIFQLVGDKDIFIKMYAKNLAKRLIQSTSQSMEAEEKLIESFKNFCGNEYVRRIERMVTDVQLSNDLLADFEDKSFLPYTFELLVIQTGSWPVQLNKSPFLAPKELEQGMQSLGNFYSSNHSGRKLHFHHGLSSCEIIINYLKKKYIIDTSIFVMSILVVFNDTESAKFSDIKATTGIAHEELKKYLQYLRAQNILLNEDGDNITDESGFNLNFKYENAKRLVKLTPVMRDQAQETKEVVKSVAEDRKMFLQALIVRIMKGKKTMNHKDLVNEVVQESIKMFVASKALIKNVIDYLIEKEFLEKDEEDSDVYNYLA